MKYEQDLNTITSMISMLRFNPYTNGIRKRGNKWYQDVKDLGEMFIIVFKVSE